MRGGENVAKKDYTYDLMDVSTGKVVCRDKTRVDLLVELGTDLNFGNCLRTGNLLKDRYQVKCRREFLRENTLDDQILAEFEIECRKFRQVEQKEGKTHEQKQSK